MTNDYICCHCGVEIDDPGLPCPECGNEQPDPFAVEPTDEDLRSQAADIKLDQIRDAGVDFWRWRVG